MCAVQMLLIHHSKQEIVLLHHDKSSSRHLPHTGLTLCICAGKTDTVLETIHAVCIYHRHTCALLCHTMKSLWIYWCMYRICSIYALWKISLVNDSSELFFVHSATFLIKTHNERKSCCTNAAEFTSSTIMPYLEQKLVIA